MPTALSIIFIIGLISALFPSADGALTALTSSYCIDILGLKRRKELDEKIRKRMRQRVHLVFAVIFFAAVMGFKWIDNKSIIDVILKVAGFYLWSIIRIICFEFLLKGSLMISLRYMYALLLHY